MNRPIAARAVFLVSIVAALSAGALVFALVAGQLKVALGIAAGTGIALACGVSWILGALVTFEGPVNRLLRATLGLGPVRFVLALGAVAAIALLAREQVDLVALGVALVAAHLLLQLIEADIFMKLTDASSKYPKAKPLNFGNFRLW